MAADMRGVTVDGASLVGLDTDRLRQAFGLLEQWVDAGIVPGAAALVARGGQIAGEAYVGRARREPEQPATAATIWGVASVTKPFTATAVMLLVERGLVSLDEPLVRLLPEFADAPTTPFDRQRVTLRHALSHCSGLPGFSEDNIALRQAHQPLEAFVRSFGRQPLLFAPGAAHYYSNPGILMAAEVVGRAVTGRLGERVDTPAVAAYHGFVQEEILAPLGMANSSLLPPAAWDERIARVEGTGQEGHDWEMTNSAYYRSLGIPWGGLFTTPRDLIRFVDLFLPDAHGTRRAGLAPEAAGKRILSGATVETMTTVQCAPPDAPLDLAPHLRDSMPAVARDSVAWGIGWEIKGEKRHHPSGELTSPATMSHLGASGAMVWADPTRDIACVLLTNRALRAGWAVDRPRQALFSNAVMAACSEQR